MPTAAAVKRVIQRKGRHVRILPTAGGLEKKLTGTEDGLVEVKVLIQEDNGQGMAVALLEKVRGAGDVSRAKERGMTAIVPAASIEFVPTERMRILDGSTTYAVALVTPRYSGAETVSYNLLLRPL